MVYVSDVLPTSCSLSVTSRPTISIHSAFVSVTFYQPVTFYLQTTRTHTHISHLSHSRVARGLLASCSRVAHKLLESCSRVTSMQLVSTHYLVAELYFKNYITMPKSIRLFALSMRWRIHKLLAFVMKHGTTYTHIATLCDKISNN